MWPEYISQVNQELIYESEQLYFVCESNPQSNVHDFCFQRKVFDDPFASAACLDCATCVAYSS